MVARRRSNSSWTRGTRREVMILSGYSSFCSEGCHRRTGVFFLGAQSRIQGEEDCHDKSVRLAVCLMVAAVVCVAQDVVNVVHGTVTKVDNGTKTVVVKSADGTEHTIKVTGDTAYKGTKEGFDGLKEGTEVVAHTTGKGVEETGLEIGKIGKDSLKVTKGTHMKINEGTKTLVVKTADETK